MPDKDQLAGLIADVREHVLFMQELGNDALDVHLPDAVQVAAPAAAAVSPEREFVRPERTSPPEDLAIPARQVLPAVERRSPGSRIAALPSLAKRSPRKLAESEAFAKQVETSAGDSDKLEQTVQMEQATTAHLGVDETGKPDTIESIRAEIGNCTRCPLHSMGRTQIVHSTGNFKARLMFVGEAPGADEDIQGFPFVGRAGQLLTKIIESIGMNRDEVFIGNINRCRPPGNRAPEPAETAACRPFLLREIAVIKPTVIVVLGATAAHNLLQVKTPISKLRGHFHDYFGVKVMPTFHPAYLLRDPHKKREVWEDMKKVRDLLSS